MGANGTDFDPEPGGDVLVTPAMVEAGVSALNVFLDKWDGFEGWPRYDEPELVSSIFSAMCAAYPVAIKKSRSSS